MGLFAKALRKLFHFNYLVKVRAYFTLFLHAVI